MSSLLLVSPLLLTKLVACTVDACILSLMNVPGTNGTKLAPENSANQPLLVTVRELVIATAFLILWVFLTKKWCVYSGSASALLGNGVVHLIPQKNRQKIN